MRIAIVLNTSWNIFNFRMGLIKSLQKKGHKIIAIAPKDEYSDKLIADGCEFHPIKMDSRGVNPIKDTALFFELIKAYRKTKPDIILHYTVKPNIYGTLASSILKIPSINNVCGLGTAFMKDNLVTRIVINLYRVAFKRSKKIFFQNNEDKELFEQKNIVADNKTDVIPGSGIDLSVFRPMVTNPDKKFTFLLISRLIYDKGVIEYIDAIKILKEKGLDAKFQILGPLDEKHRRGIPKIDVEEWINNEYVEYLGTSDDVKLHINKSDCVVLPSYREGTPRTLLEAASSAKPIVTTNVPGCNNVVENNFNGFLCEVKNASDLADKMDKMASLSLAERNLMGLNSRKKMKMEFDEKFVIDRYLETIEAL